MIARRRVAILVLIFSAACGNASANHAVTPGPKAISTRSVQVSNPRLWTLATAPTATTRNATKISGRTPTTTLPRSPTSSPSPKVSTQPTESVTTTSIPVVFSGSDGTSTNTADWACIRQHESGGDYQIGGMEPYGGAYQFSVGTWQGLGFSGVPNQASSQTQDRAALALYAYDLRVTGNPWSAWETAPMCGL